MSPVPYELQKANAGARKYDPRTKYHLRGGKITGIVAVDIAARPTYPEAANHVGILSFKNTLSLFFCSSSNLEPWVSEKVQIKNQQSEKKKIQLLRINQEL